jgi:hypothetical protein
VDRPRGHGDLRGGGGVYGERKEEVNEPGEISANRKEEKKKKKKKILSIAKPAFEIFFFSVVFFFFFVSFFFSSKSFIYLFHLNQSPARP